MSSSSGLLSMISPSIRPVLSFTTGCSLRVSRRRRTEQPARNAGSHRAQWAPDRETYGTCGNMDRQELTDDGRPVQRHAVAPPNSAPERVKSRIGATEHRTGMPKRRLTQLGPQHARPTTFSILWPPVRVSHLPCIVLYELSMKYSRREQTTKAEDRACLLELWRQEC